MKRKFTASFVLLLLLTALLFPSTVWAAADEAVINIPFEKHWNATDADERPASITIRLYRYSGTWIGESNATLVAEKNVSAADGWKTTFLKVQVTNGAQYKVVEMPVAGYAEETHTDPAVTVTPFAASGWTRITPNNQLTIPVSGNVIAFKKGEDFAIWSKDSLSAAQYTAITQSLAANEPSFNAILSKGYDTFYGFGASLNGATVNESSVVFGHESQWSLLAVGTYTHASMQVTGASITNRPVLLVPNNPPPVPNTPPTTGDAATPILWGMFATCGLLGIIHLLRDRKALFK